MLWQNLGSFLLNVLQLLLPAFFLYLLVLLIRAFERCQFADLIDELLLPSLQLLPVWTLLLLLLHAPLFLPPASP